MLALVADGIAALFTIPAAANPRGAKGKILIGNADNSVTGHEQVYTVDPDGSDLSLLADDVEASQWSPDGSRISLFTAFGEGILNSTPGASPTWGCRTRSIRNWRSSAASGPRTPSGLPARALATPMRA
jgi:Tol biopolymer transport system component